MLNTAVAVISGVPDIDLFKVNYITTNAFDVVRLVPHAVDVLK